MRRLCSGLRYPSNLTEKSRLRPDGECQIAKKVDPNRATKMADQIKAETAFDRSRDPGNKVTEK